jgi:BirA family biotin operon repressor/biotin-[acetyl-CoA-carboxylase] ligase
MTDDLSSSAISEGLSTHALGRPILVFDSLESTNDKALEFLEQGLPHGTLVLSDRQTKGRGQRGREWHSPGGGLAIHASLVLRAPAAVRSFTLVVAAVGLGLAEGLEAATGVDIDLKWPNDLWSGGLKLGGVLVEARGIDPAKPAFVAGFGLNVNQREADFPEDLRATATSVALRTGRRNGRGDVVRHLLQALEPRIDAAFVGDADELQKRFRMYSLLRGRRVRLLDGGQPRQGLVVDLSATEGLLLRVADGSHVHIRAEHAREVRML